VPHALCAITAPVPSSSANATAHPAPLSHCASTAFLLSRSLTKFSLVRERFFFSFVSLLMLVYFYLLFNYILNIINYIFKVFVLS